MPDTKREALLARVLEARVHTRAALLEFERLHSTKSKRDSRRSNTNTNTKEQSDG